MDLYEALESNVPQDKVVLVGNPGVGKSTIFQRFKTGKFVPVEELTHHDKEGQECYKAWTVGDRQVTVSYISSTLGSLHSVSCVSICGSLLIVHVYIQTGYVYSCCASNSYNPTDDAL